MSTNADINFFLDGKCFVSIYKHYDGYAIGEWLKENFAESRIVNGFNEARGEAAPQFFNGMECFAAWVVKELKECIGDVYIMPYNADNNREWEYTLYPDGKEIRLDVANYGKQVYSGKLSDYNP
jgi:hypothetical protein